MAASAIQLLISLGDYPRTVVFDSEAFIVLSNDSLEEPMFEVVQKLTNRHSFLTEVPARCLCLQIQTWQSATPEQVEVEVFLDQLTWLGSIPMLMH